MCTPEVYTMKFQLLDYLVENIKIFENISVLDTYAYEQLNVNMKRPYQMSSTTRATHLQKIEMLTELQ